ncbi:MAG: HlyD family efflux transporter periplasmic adaptor subunit [Verrucomicrobia bacterium]|nr:HlyD family efflux transporter periplasmic adaptor subunit [Verrucomicrobiota bacterium]
MNDLPPIPIPSRLRWTAFCTEKLPFVVFALGVAAVAVLWNHSVTPSLVAEAETVSAEVRSAQGGTLTTLDVALFQPVTAGQVIGHVQVADPKLLAASLAVIRAEIALMRANLEPVLPAQRVALDAGRLQLDWMHERVTLASLRVQLQQAEAELVRLRPLFEKNIVSVEIYETARLQRENLSAQLTEQTKLVETLGPAAREFSQRSAESTPRPAAETLAAATHVQEEKLRLTETQLGTVALTAPLDGVVSAVHRRAGESLKAGEPIVTVAATQSARLVGFVRQPLAFEPKPGMTVDIRRRTAARQTAPAKITAVGGVLEPVSPTILALLNRANTPELGLRIHIAAPAALNLRPGEQVDVTIRE